MDADLLIFAPIIATSLDVAAHIALSHARLRGGQRSAILIGFLIGLAAVVWLTLRALGDSPSAGDLAGYLFVNLGAFWGLAFGYFGFVNMNIASLRLRILKEMMENPAKQISVSALLEGYNAKSILGARLARLAQGGELVLIDGRYYSGKPTMLYIARLMDVLKYIILGSSAVRRFDAPSTGPKAGHD